MRTLLIPAVLLSVGSAGAAPAAQGSLSGSASRVALAPVQPAAAGRIESPSFAADAVLGNAPAGERVDSPQYRLTAGVATTPPSLGAAAPVVFGAVPPLVPKAGGTPLTVYGFALDDSSGTAAVALGDAPATQVVVHGNTSLSAVAPPGVDGFANPLGPVGIEVVNANGTARRESAAVYTPATVQECPAHVGGELVLRFHQPAGNAYALLLGASIPGFALPLPPIEGALVPVDGLTNLPPVGIATGDDVRVLPVPPNPNLAGVTLELQAVSLTSLSPALGSFTNAVEVTILP